MTWDFVTQGPKVKLAFGPAEFGLAEFSTCPTSHQQWTTSKFRPPCPRSHPWTNHFKSYSINNLNYYYYYYYYYGPDMSAHSIDNNTGCSCFGMLSPHVTCGYISGTVLIHSIHQSRVTGLPKW